MYKKQSADPAAELTSITAGSFGIKEVKGAAEMNRLLLIADDFTGALDTGIQFAGRGISTEVFADDKDFAGYTGDADVLVVNTNTRNSAAEEAYGRVRKAVRSGIGAGANCFYKKTDSALRGNIGSELQAVLDEANEAYNTKEQAIQFVPALPQMNRVTKGGVHFIDGVPAAESEFARDKYAPVTRSSVKEIIGDQSDAPVYIHSKRNIGTEPGIHVYDAESDSDLGDIAALLGEKSAYHMLAGCSGMAGTVPELLGLKGNKQGKTDFLHGLIAICGSTNKVTREQIEYAEMQGFVHMNMGPEQTLDRSWRSGESAGGFLRACIDGFRKTGRLVIDTNDPEPGRTAEYAGLHKLDADCVRNGISDTLGWLLKEMLDEGTRATIMLTGGDTLLGFLKNIDTMQLTPVCELDAGVVLSYLNYAGVDYPVISKSGGFGRHDLIARLADKIERSFTMNKPIIGITMGDPYGSGADISVKALADPEIYDRCRPLVVGDACCMEYAAEVAAKVSGINVNIHPVKSVGEALFEPGTIDVFDMGVMTDEDIPKSEVPQPFNIGSCAKGGEAAFQYVVEVIELAMAHEIDGTVTNALSKEAINMAGHHFSGHTEIYAHYTGTKKYTMMLAHNDFRVVHVSTHVSLREACDRVKKDRVLEVIRIANDACKSLGITEPKIGVAGLNPHCGENGLFGTEEVEEIQPAIDQAMAEGIIIPEKKPTPPDTVFSKAIGGWYDIVVAMYHDQGHIPVKVKGFVYNREKKEWDAVAGINVTLGLPIIRASVDHGTDFVHAGSGTSNEISLVNAIDYAVRIANNA